MLYYIFVLVAFLIALCLARLIIPQVIYTAWQKHLFDETDERKVHVSTVPRLAGFSFMPILLISLAFMAVVGHVFHCELQTLRSIPIQFYSLVCGLILLYLIGLKDDLVGSRYRVKFALQLVAASLIPVSGLWINNLYGLFGIYVLPAWVGILLTIFVIVLIINAINLIDGIDGLAAGLSSISLVIMGVCFLFLQYWSFALLAFIMQGVLVPFFFYNVFGQTERNTKIFMGDTGSLTLGYVLAFLLIRLSTAGSESMFPTGSCMIVAFSSLLVPVFDVCRVIWIRYRNKRNLFLPDQNHIHHKFLKMGFTPQWTMISILCLSVFFCILSMSLLTVVDINFLLFINIILWISLHHLFNQFMHKRRIWMEAVSEEMDKMGKVEKVEKC